jgi:hypothetical protein
MNKVQRIEQIEKELALLKQEVKEENGFKMFPQEGETYWYFSLIGTIFNFIGGTNITYTNAYKNKEEAEEARDIAVAKHKLKQIIEWKNDGWTPDWSNSEQLKYLFRSDYFFDFSKNIFIDWDVSIKVQPNWLYIKDRETAEWILDEG